MQHVRDTDCEVSFMKKQTGVGASALLGQEGRRQQILTSNFCVVWVLFPENSAKSLLPSPSSNSIDYLVSLFKPLSVKLTELFSVVFKEP